MLEIVRNLNGFLRCVLRTFDILSLIHFKEKEISTLQFKMSSSEDEYKAVRADSLARKRALFAELGIDNLTKEIREVFASALKTQKVRKQVRRKVVKKLQPSRRSLRIQKKARRVKFIKGFMGFESNSESEGSSDDSNKVIDGTIKSDSVNIDSTENPASKFSVEPEKCDQSEYGNKKTDLKGYTISNAEISGQNKGLISVFDNVLVTENIKSSNKVGCIGVEGYEHVKPENVDIDSKFLEGGASLKKINNSIGETSEELMESAKNSQFLDTPWYMRTEKDCLEIIKKGFKESSKFNSLLTCEMELSESEDDWNKYEQVAFVVSTSDESDGSSDSENMGNPIFRASDCNNRPRRQTYHSKNLYSVPTLSCEEITDCMISNTAIRSFEKVYDQVNGTTCHQCRQKTLDTKTVCRSGRCVGVRGMFCGVCLPKRYGETVQEALKNPLWECPVCRGICNCSICRTRIGKHPTGIMYPEARLKGYGSVAEYLKDKENKVQKEKRVKVVGNASF